MGRRLVLPLLLAVACGACASTAPRGYYAPLGAPRSEKLASWQHVDEEAVFVVACQGFYVNTVGGTRVRTMHFQLAATWASPGELAVPLPDLRIDLVWDGEERTTPLGVAEVWQGTQRVHEVLVVPAWSRRSVDLFFDHPDPDLPVPHQVRLRWRYRTGDAWARGDATFLRIPPDDPSLPGEETLKDEAFGMLHGYYLPGPPDLGRRQLQESTEMRAHYVFHAPGRWF